MVWTNITIPNKYDKYDLQRKDIVFLNFKLEQKQIELDALYQELENIFESLKENKKIILSYNGEKLEACLIETTGE